jgi:hypothetical protein
MKNILILVFCLLSFNSFAQTLEVDILSAEFGVEDYHHNKTLCLTVVRVPSTGALLGIVEDIHDCFIARAAKKSPNHKLRVDLKRLIKYPSPQMRQHLQTIDAQLEFLFSDGE